jgi:hypothetical protein
MGSVLARACAIPVSPGLTTTTLTTCGSRSDDRHAPPETSNATRSSRPKLAASTPSASGGLSTRPAERTPPFSQIATSQKSRCTSNPIALPSALNATSSPDGTSTKENVGKRQRRIRARSAPGPVAGAATEKARAHSPSSKPACPQRSPTKPLCPGHRSLRDPARTSSQPISCPERHAPRCLVDRYPLGVDKRLSPSGLSLAVASCRDGWATTTRRRAGG